MNIKNNDIVLEIGPGAYPFWRSDCLADVYDESSVVDDTQFGGAEFNTKGKPLFKIVDGKLPFKDKSFDYIICSHVFEHVPAEHLQGLVAEIMRVAKKAYIEFPRPLYDYIYNFSVHLNLLDIVNGEIICLAKKMTKLHAVNNFQEYSMVLRKSDNFSVDEYYASVMAVGMEFHHQIPFRIIDSEDAFISDISKNNYFVKRPSLKWMIWNKIRPARVMRYIRRERPRQHFIHLLQ